MIALFNSADLWVPVVGMLCLACVSAFFSGSETALFSLTRDELRRFRIGGAAERLVARLLLDPDRLLTAILFWNLVINVAFFAVSVVAARRLVAAGDGTAAGLFSLVAVLGIIIFGEVLPKSIALAFHRRLAVLVCIPLVSAVKVLDRAVPLFRTLTRSLRLAFWPKVVREPYLETEDLERAVEASAETEDLARQERIVLDNILELSELTVEEAMRPRGTYLSLVPPVGVANLHGEVPPSDYLTIRSRDSEEIEGAVALASFSQVPRVHLESAAEEVLHVPWCATLAYTLQLLRDRFCSVAAVVNEYGETIGIITYEDIIDTILVPDPSRARRLLQREPVLEVAPGKYQVEGITTLRYLCRRLNIDYDPDSEDVVTVAGMLHDELEHIPEVGDECTWRGYRIRVIEAPRRGRIRVVLSPAEELRVEG